MLDEQLGADISALFPGRREAALAWLGADSTIDPVDLRPPLDSAVPLAERVLAYEHQLRADLHLCAQQIEEFPESDPYFHELRGQGTAILIDLRELHRHFPEVFQAVKRAEAPR
jgi:hypothetical protein